MPVADKQELERRIIEWARERSPLLPKGDLERPKVDGPDWLIPSARVGIEVSQLLPEKAPGTLFSPPQLSRFQQEVVSTAERFYGDGGDQLDVAVYFTNDWTRRNDANAMGRALADFVRSNYPTDGIPVTLDDETPDGFAVVSIAPIKGGWHANGINSGEYLTYELLSSRIAQKSRLVAEYRRRLPENWQVWLLFATRLPVLWSLSCPPEIETWRFDSEFDRLFLSSWDYGVLELGAYSSREK